MESPRHSAGAVCHIEVESGNAEAGSEGFGLAASRAGGASPTGVIASLRSDLVTPSTDPPDRFGLAARVGEAEIRRGSAFGSKNTPTGWRRSPLKGAVGFVQAAKRGGRGMQGLVVMISSHVVPAAFRRALAGSVSGSGAGSGREQT